MPFAGLLVQQAVYITFCQIFELNGNKMQAIMYSISSYIKMIQGIHISMINHSNLAEKNVGKHKSKCSYANILRTRYFIF